jgi:ribose/xylose/arabinose/galactoside ABC-type transport system permease subunit
MAVPIEILSPGNIHRAVLNHHSHRGFRKVVAGIAWWVACLVTPLLAVSIGLIYGILIGAYHGVALALNETKLDLTQWWAMIDDKD